MVRSRATDPLLSRVPFGISAFGVKVGVRVPELSEFHKLASYLPLGWKVASAAGANRIYAWERLKGSRCRSHRLYRDGEEVLRCAEEQQLLDFFESDVAIHVAERARNRVFVHAGVVGWQGRAIVIPGRSFSGKSTLVTALLQAGAVYYSDEYAVFDRHGRVHPYARALQLRTEGDRRQTRWSPEKLGAVAGTKPLPLGLVLATRYRKGAHWRPRQISAGRGLLELLNNTVSARREPEAALDSFRSALMQAKIFRGLRGDAAETVSHLLTQMR